MTKKMMDNKIKNIQITKSISFKIKNNRGKKNNRGEMQNIRIYNIIIRIILLLYE